MASDSKQHTKGKSRPPRVHITYDVDDNGALKQVELPFVVGVMADLAGEPKEALKPLDQRRFVDIDRDTFNSVMEKSGARVTGQVDNTLSGDGSKLSFNLEFKSMDDFSPAGVVKQVEPLRKLLEVRDALKRLQSIVQTRPQFEAALNDIITNMDKR